MNLTQQTAFQQGAAWQQAYSLLFLGKQAKLYRTEGGVWICSPIVKREEIGEVK